MTEEDLRRKVAAVEAAADTLRFELRNWEAYKRTLEQMQAEGRDRDQKIQEFQKRVAELETWRGALTTTVNLLRASVQTAFRGAGIDFRFIQGD